MSSDALSLLFRLRGDASSLKSVVAEARVASQQIKQSFGPELSQTLNVTNKAFNQVGADLANLATQRVPVVNTAVTRLTDLLRGVGVESKSTQAAVNNVANSIANISQQSGRSVPQVAQFLSRFVQLGDQSKKNEAAFKEFGGSVDLIGNKTARFTPELEKASSELDNVAAASASTGGRLAALAGPIGAAVIAVAALVAGLILVGKAMFDVSRHTAEFQGRMQDLSQQTGLAVETLSTLEVAITTTGGSLNTVTQAIVQFQRQLDEAQDPLSEAAKNFEQLGVAVEDTESTLRNALRALAAMPEGFQQTNAAAELFGSRGGKQVLALLKETNGDIDALQRRLAETGVLITGDAARAADKFNDELALLNFQTRALSAALAEDLIPAFTELIKGTAEIVRSLTPLLKLLIDISLIGIPFRVAISVMSDSLRGWGLVVRALTGDFKGLKQAIREAREEKFPTIPPLEIPAPAPVPLPERTAAQDNTEDAQLAADALAIIRRSAAETNQALSEAFEQGRINRQRQADGVIASNRQILEADKARIETEIKAEETKHQQIQARRDLADSERIDQLQQIQGRVRRLQQEQLNAEALFETTSREIRARAAKERADSLRNQARNEEEIFLGELDREIKRAESRIATGKESEEKGLRFIEEFEQGKIDARRESLEEQQRIGFLTIENQKEILTQLQQLDQDADRLRDEQEARRQQRDRDRAARTRQAKLDEIQTLLSLERIAGESIIASIEAQAALRIRSEESAAREIQRVRLSLLDDELEALKAQQEAAAGITDEQERNQVIAQAVAAIRVLTAQRAAAVAEGARVIEGARQRDLASEAEYADDLADAQRRIVRIQRDALQETIRLMIIGGARRRDIIRAQRELDLAEESDRHQRALESIRRQQQENDAEIRLLERRLESLRIGTTEEIEEYERLTTVLETLRQKRAEINTQREQEGALSATIAAAINLGAAQDEDEADPLGRIKSSVADLRRVTSDIESSITPLNDALKQSFLGVAQAISQVVANYVLLGTTGPAALRKVLAVALASIAAEATVNAIKETALGFAMLFLNPADSAAHFTAAGLWASIAGGAALAGRGVAGNLFQQQGATGSNGSGNQGPSSQLNPLTLERNTQVVRHEHVFRVESNDSHILDVFSKDYQAGGKTRELVIKDGEFSI